MATFSHTPSRISRPLKVSRLTALGLSSAGARQALDGQVISDPNDRNLVAGLLDTALADAWPAKWKGFSLNGKGNSA